MEKIWLAHYPAGVPHEIDPDQYRCVGELLEAAFRRNARRTVAHCLGSSLSYEELDHHSAAVGAWLQAQGLPAGARVAIMLPNVPQFLATMAGVLRAGYTCVNVNPLYTARELEHQLKDSGAEAIVILENFAHTLEEVIDHTALRHIVVASLGDMLGTWRGPWTTFAVRHLARMVPRYKLALQAPDGGNRTIVPFKQVMADGAKLSLKPGRATADSIAFLQYTGGTTGVSKGAVLTHRNIIAATLQAEAWFAPALSKVPNGVQPHHIMALPLYHIFALTLSLLVIRSGGAATLIPNPRDINQFVEVLKQRPFHVLPAVNTLFNGLLQNAAFRKLDFSNFVLSQAGGMAASEGTAQQWQTVTGCTMIEGWGMSETCAIGTNNPVTNERFTGTIGLPLPSIEMAIKDEAGQDLPPGGVGEICIRGPNVMPGYYNQPEESAKAFTADGYLRTGDLGTMDGAGYIRIVDRKKDMIIVSGFNVFPNELDNVISMCPGVVECAAVGVPDEHSGEAIKIYAVRSDPTLSEEDLMRYCHDNLTGYKRPKYIEFRDELPKSNVGKILRRELRQTA